mmetsp:Transcript_43095/g.100992  ORF Transcript_43095/g.100992 Transcript_43095/m.100992 type:complete len:302 (-) Transcript_43095:387-1292(-)
MTCRALAISRAEGSAAWTKPGRLACAASHATHEIASSAATLAKRNQPESAPPGGAGTGARTGGCSLVAPTQSSSDASRADLMAGMASRSRIGERSALSKPTSNCTSSTHRWNGRTWLAPPSIGCPRGVASSSFSRQRRGRSSAATSCRTRTAAALRRNCSAPATLAAYPKRTRRDAPSTSRAAPRSNTCTSSSSNPAAFSLAASRVAWAEYLLALNCRAPSGELPRIATASAAARTAGPRAMVSTSPNRCNMRSLLAFGVETNSFMAAASAACCSGSAASRNASGNFFSLANCLSDSSSSR